MGLGLRSRRVSPNPQPLPPSPHQVELHGPPAHWGWGAGDAFGIEPKRQPMAVIFLIDRTFEAFLQKVVDAVVTV